MLVFLRRVFLCNFLFFGNFSFNLLSTFIFNIFVPCIANICKNVMKLVSCNVMQYQLFLRRLLSPSIFVLSCLHGKALLMFQWIESHFSYCGSSPASCNNYIQNLDHFYRRCVCMSSLHSDLEYAKKSRKPSTATITSTGSQN